MTATETYWSLMRSLPHWELELTIMILIDGIMLGILWPRIRQWRAHHAGDDAHDRADDQRVEDLRKRLTLLEESHGTHHLMYGCCVQHDYEADEWVAHYLGETNV